MDNVESTAYARRLVDACLRGDDLEVVLRPVFRIPPVMAAGAGDGQLDPVSERVLKVVDHYIGDAIPVMTALASLCACLVTLAAAFDGVTDLDQKRDFVLDRVGTWVAIAAIELEEGRQNEEPKDNG